QEEMNRLKTEMASRVIQAQEMEEKLQLVQQERSVLNDRLTHFNEVLGEYEEVNNELKVNSFN
ncbi:unnamed protein product, partial [Rotaria socialis]